MTKVTYHAPEDDSEVVTMRGVRFFDGQPVDLDEAEHAELFGKLRTNQHFEVSGDAPKAKKEPKKTEESGLKAVHNGGGRFVIKKDGEVIKDGLTKADSDAFNALSDEDKAAYVE